MFQHVTRELILSSVQAIAEGKEPAIEAGLLAHHLPHFLGITPPAPLSTEYCRMQRRFHAQAVVSWAVLGRGSEHVLVPLGTEWEAVSAERDAAIARGLYMVGCVGLTAEHAPLVLTEPEPTAEDFAILMQACLVSLWSATSLFSARNEAADTRENTPNEQHSASNLPQTLGGVPGHAAGMADAAAASAHWLAGLMALEDPRPDKLAN